MARQVLILDADAAARDRLARVARESFGDDVQFTEASDPGAARRLIGSTGGHHDPSGVDPFWLLLIDLRLLEDDGFELLADLARYPAVKVVVARNPDDPPVLRAMTLGAHGHLLQTDSVAVQADQLRGIVLGQPPMSASIARRLRVHFHVGLSAGAAPLNAPMQGDPRSQPGNRSAARGRARLTARESEVLIYLSKGFTIDEIANLEGLPRQVVGDRIKSIYRKLSGGPEDDAAQSVVDAPAPRGGAPQAAVEPLHPAASDGEFDGMDRRRHLPP